MREIQIRRRFIKQKDARFRRERTREYCALAFATRQLVHQPRFETREFRFAN